jgi:hypothetical protein
MFFTNYIANRLPFEYVDGRHDQIVVDNKVYTILDNSDPEYMDDGIVDISFFNLQDDGGEIVDNMFWAFDKIEDVGDPCEWSDEYDADHPFVIIFK